MNCRLIELAVPLADGSTRKVCPACGRVVDLPGPARGFKAKCGGWNGGDRVVALSFSVAPPRRPRSEPPATIDLPERPSFDSMPCVHRGDLLPQTITCGLCGAIEEERPVARCAVFGLCTPLSVGRTDRQKVDGVRPQVCLGCPRCAPPAVVV